MSQLQTRRRDPAAKPAEHFPNASPGLFQGFSAGADSSLGQGGGHRRTLRLPPESGEVLGVSRLDLREAKRYHGGELEGPSAVIRNQRQRSRHAATGPLHGYEGDRGGSERVHCRSERAEGG